MEFFETVCARRSIRKFQKTTVEPDKMAMILGAVQQAPSAGNAQALRLFIVEEASARQALARAAGNQPCVAEAPVVLVACADPLRSAAIWGSKGQQLLCLQDATVACVYAQLAATALGLASIWLGAVIEPESIRQVLGIEEDLWPIALLPLGYPAEQPLPRPRRPIQEIAIRWRPTQHT